MTKKRLYVEQGFLYGDGPVRNATMPEQTLGLEIERLERELRAQHAAYNAMLDKAAALERRNAVEPSVPQYRKWPGEPPHCMSCDCGMTEEQKKTVPLEDYLRVHRMFMDLKYPDMPYNQNRCFICGADHGNLPCPKMTVTCGYRTTVKAP